MNLLLAACTGALLVSAVPAQAAMPPVDCATANTTVDKAICATPALLEQDREIARRYSDMAKFCIGERGAMLKETQHFWMRARNACSNDAETAISCASDLNQARLGQFLEMGAACEFKDVAAQLNYVDPWFVNQFALQFEGVRTHVHGSVRLDDCSRGPDETQAARGMLREIGRRGKQDLLRVVFKSMPVLTREFLCARNPGSHWHGEVRLDADGPYLYLTDVLGAELP